MGQIVVDFPHEYFLVWVNISVCYYKMNFPDNTMTIHIVLKLDILQPAVYWCVWNIFIYLVVIDSFVIFYITPLFDDTLIHFIIWGHDIDQDVPCHVQNNSECKFILYPGFKLWLEEIHVFDGDLVVPKMFFFEEIDFIFCN